MTPRRQRSTGWRAFNALASLVLWGSLVYGVFWGMQLSAALIATLALASIVVPAAVAGGGVLEILLTTLEGMFAVVVAIVEAIAAVMSSIF